MSKNIGRNVSFVFFFYVPPLINLKTIYRDDEKAVQLKAREGDCTVIKRVAWDLFSGPPDGFAASSSSLVRSLTPTLYQHSPAAPLDPDTMQATLAAVRARARVGVQSFY